MKACSVPGGAAGWRRGNTTISPVAEVARTHRLQSNATGCIADMPTNKVAPTRAGLNVAWLLDDLGANTTGPASSEEHRRVFTHSQSGVEGAGPRDRLAPHPGDGITPRMLTG
jgi:hypothetical protein